MIEFKNVTFAYRSVNAQGETISKNGIKNLNLTIRKGEFIVLTGGSGCGKTTITRLINGLIPHYYKGELSGEITIDGRSVPDTTIFETAKKVGSVFQNPRSQFFNVNTTDEIAFAAENQSRDPLLIKNLIKETAELMQIEKLLDRNIFELSGGEKQIVACAGINVLSPDIIVLDEPSSNLDHQVIEKFRKILENWKLNGKTIIAAEHRLFFLRELADRMFILENGEIRHELDSNAIKSLTYEDTEKLGIRSLYLNDLKPVQPRSNISSEMLTLENFYFKYKDEKHGINIPNLSVPVNSIIAVIGHNGAGKSTLARNICGLEKKCKGTLNVSGKKLNAKHRLHNCYMIMQDVNHQLFTESVKDEVMLSMAEKSLSDSGKEKRAIDILSALDLAECAEIHPMALSGGQKQRVAIASGIASDKPIIVFDEPTSGLDLMHMKQVSDEMINLRDMGKTVFVVTHDIEFILTCCDHVVQLENGSISETYNLTDSTTEKLFDFFSIN